MPLKLLLLLLVLPVPALAAVDWRCWYDLKQQVACVVRLHESARQWSASGVRPTVLSMATTPPRSMRAGGLPPSIRLLRNQPAALRNGTILIPLYTEPFDHALVAELAQAVMCGRDPDCTAHYGDQPEMTLADAIDLTDANDPLLARPE